MPPTTIAHRLAWRDEQRFVGREQELAFFDRLLVDDPPASVVLVHGPGGIGKSTLLREVARRGAKRGWAPRFVEGRELAPVPGEIDSALDGVQDDEQPLIMFDTYERMAAAGGYLRQRLLPSLPERSLVVLAGRRAPEPDWFQGGWERLSVELELKPMTYEDALALCRENGVVDEAVAADLIGWAEGSPLALQLAAAAATAAGESWDPSRFHDRPELVRSLVRRLAQTELDGGNLDVAGVAALARVTTARLLRDVLPEIDPEEAEAWLRTRTFAEPVGDGVTLHDLVRKALRADLRARTPERERELRKRIADHLHRRAIRGETRLMTDLAELVDNPAVRWGFGAEGSPRFRIDDPRPDDAETVKSLMADRGDVEHAWWAGTAPFFRDTPDRVVVARDQHDTLAGYAIAVTPDNAPRIAEEDPLLGPWLAHAREHYAGFEVLLWRESVDFTSSPEGDQASPVVALLNTAAILRSGLVNMRFSYLPITPANEAALQFAKGVGAVHAPELDMGGTWRSTQCWILDHGEGGVLGGARAMVYTELGLPDPGPAPVPAPERPPAPGTAVPPGAPVTAEDVREALRSLDRPLDLAASPLATGANPAERAESVRALLDEAATSAFGEAPDEQLLRRILVRGYLDPAPSHELAADELNVSRATYFRRLRAASQRVADWVIASRDGAGGA